MSGSNVITVLLVDDSAVIRSALTKIIHDAADEIQVVASAGNGKLGVEEAKTHQPDIVILDVEMPEMNGLEALPKILEVSPKTKVLMFSTLTDKGAEVTMKALSLGAVEALVKPSSLTDSVQKLAFKEKLLTSLRTIGGAKSRAYLGLSKEKREQVEEKAPITLRSDLGAYTGKPDIIAIGSSTGGPQAVLAICKHFEGIDIPIILTQHMPETFTKILAEHIDTQTPINAVEADNGMELQKGRVHVAKGGKHMILHNSGGVIKLKLDDGPLINFCKPSVDPMMESAIELYGKKVLGVILTGMGHDGHGGSAALVGAGGRVIAQDEETSVVWGMPGKVAEAGICSAVLPLEEIGPWIRKAVLG